MRPVHFCRFYFQSLGYALSDAVTAPLLHLLSPGLSQRPAAAKTLQSISRTLGVFAFSGLLHEYLTLAAFGSAGGSYMVFFMLHGLLVVGEGLAGKLIIASRTSAVTRRLRQGQFAAGTGERHGRTAWQGGPRRGSAVVKTWLGRLYTIGVTAALGPLFVEPYRAAGYFRTSFHAFGVPVAASIAGRLGLCGCGGS